MNCCQRINKGQAFLALIRREYAQDSPRVSTSLKNAETILDSIAAGAFARFLNRSLDQSAWPTRRHFEISVRTSR